MALGKLVGSWLDLVRNSNCIPNIRMEGGVACGKVRSKTSDNDPSKLILFRIIIMEAIIIAANANKDDFDTILYLTSHSTGDVVLIINFCAK